MKNLSKTMIAVVCLISVLVAGCDTKKDEARKAATGRFELVSELYLLDGNHNLYPNTGSIWKDRSTGKCYLYMFAGSGNGGPALTPFECN